MSEKNDESTQKHPDQSAYGGSPTTGQMRSVGQRRRDAEEKLEHHLEEVRHKEDSRSADVDKDDDGKADEAKGDAGAVDSGDIADIQNDDRLTAADRVDLIANQALAGDDEGRPAREHDKKD
jgi:hypothetical protein